MQYKERKEKTIRLTIKQRELAGKIVDVDTLVSSGDLENLLDALDDFVVGEFVDEEQNELSDEGSKYEHLRSDIFMYNNFEDYKPLF